MSKQRKCYGTCFYSINVQAVCDSDTFIANIVARWAIDRLINHAFLRTARSRTNEGMVLFMTILWVAGDTLLDHI